MNIFSYDNKNSVRNFNIFLLFLSAFVFAVLYYCAGRASFWYDELCTVSSVRSSLSFSDTVRIYATKDNQSPLYPFIAYFWYRIVPHTERALRSLSIIFALSGCVMIGIIGRKLYGVRFGIFSFLSGICSSYVLVNAAIDFRPYSLLLLVSSLNYYFYLRRLEDESWPNIILYGLTMGLMPYTHYVSVIFCFGLFISDCVMIFRKRACLLVIVSYFIGALIFLPWFCFLLPVFANHFALFWPGVPNLISIIRLGKSIIFSPFLFSLGVLCIIRHLYRHCSRHENFSPESRFLIAGIFASFFMVIIVYIYSRYINPQAPFFVERYFFPIFPFAAFMAAYGAEFIFSRLCTEKRELIFALMFMSILVQTFYSAAEQRIHTEPYRETAYLIHKNESENVGGRTALLTTDSRYMYNGLGEMYFSLYDETKSMPSFSLPLSIRNNAEMNNTEKDKNILEKLQQQHYERIYFCFLHNKSLEKYKNQRVNEIMKWLYENYNIIKADEEHRFQVLELRR